MAYTTLVSPDVLYEHVSNPEWAIVDCRFSLKDTAKGRRDYVASHLPNAVYAHLDEDLSGPIIPGKTGRHPLPDIDTFAQTLGSMGISNTTQVIAYDDMGGPLAARLWWMLRWLGHDAVAVLNGGWQHWIQKGYPVTTEVPSPRSTTFIPAPRMEMIASVDTIQRLDDAILLDARAYERFAGIHEPIDPVAGHIPGAVSFPFKENLDESGTFKSIQALQERFTSLDQRQPDKPIICYCGSGVTAAHNILALTHAGIRNVMLYPGSWSEWILDSDRSINRIKD